MTSKVLLFSWNGPENVALTTKNGVKLQLHWIFPRKKVFQVISDACDFQSCFRSPCFITCPCTGGTEPRRLQIAAASPASMCA
ncbi:hypothetical protein Y1Q_0004140 [Alligator mississippiensis]|nr:hypothetical protein Y1Q_0004140 [Alligator mississippiensis]